MKKFWLCTGAIVLLALGTVAGCQHESDRISLKGQLGADGLSRAMCTGVPTWESTFESAEPGLTAQNRGSLYQCKQGQAGALCTQKAYEPGGRSPYWNESWDDLGICTDDSVEGNRLVLNLPTRPDVAATGQQRSKQDTPVTGTLRCSTNTVDTHTFSGQWGQSINVDGLTFCDYLLVMDVVDGNAPVNAPVKVRFKESERQVVTYDVRYKAPVDTSQLLALPKVKVDLFAQGVLQARQMTLGKNMLYVGSSSIPGYGDEDTGIAGFIYALPLEGSTLNPSGKMHLAAWGEVEPHGVAYRDGDLYYSTTGRLKRIAKVDETYLDPHAEDVLKFPADDVRFPLPYIDQDDNGRQWHQKHPVRFNPYDPRDRKLYTAIGIPCNICTVPDDTRYGTVLAYDLDTKEVTLLAKGVRNSVGFDWNPATKEIWFSDNNRQEIPNPDEINRIDAKMVQPEFGVPYVFGNDTIGYTDEERTGKGALDPNRPYLVKGAVFGRGLPPPSTIDPSAYAPPAITLANNSAPLGVRYVANSFCPSAPANSQCMLVAVHGGGSTDDPGMEVRAMTVLDNKVVQVVPLLSSWQPGAGAPLGRPVEFLSLPDESVLVSDDIANAIYRLTPAPAQLAGGTVSITMGAAPTEAAGKQMPSGVLIDPDGRRRRFHMGWEAPQLSFEGLPFGKYRVVFDDVGLLAAPVQSSFELDLSEAAPVQLVAGGFSQIPQVQAQLTFQAPPPPEGATGDWMVKLQSPDGTTQELSIPWGQSKQVSVGYGQYQFIYPYFSQAMPFPAKDGLKVTQNGEVPVPPVTYKQVPSLGAAMLDGPCLQCHSNRLQNPFTAASWNKAGPEALMAKVKIMGGHVGHCEGVCAEEVSTYLLGTAWRDYLQPSDPVGPQQLRLLARDEYTNSIKDLLNVDVDLQFVPNDRASKYFLYPAQASLGILTTERLRDYYNLATEVAGKANLEELGYDPAQPETFVRSLGRLVFRRALTDSEATRYQALLSTQGETLDGPHLMVAAMLMSPHFLYRSELGKELPDSSGRYQLTPEELATALSFGYLGTTPSDDLLTTAEEGRLETEDQIRTVIDGMLDSPRGQEQFLRFVRYYTATASPLQTKEPELNEAVRDAMLAEQSEFVRGLIRDKGSVSDLFNPGYTYLNQALATHYGITGVDGEQMRKVELSGGKHDRRGGLLHQGVFLASDRASNLGSTAMIRRGFLVRENMLCREFGLMENDSQVPNFPDAPVSMRQRWDLVNGKDAPTKNCYTCHKYVNDTGASMENYDQMGRYRTQEYAVNRGYEDRLVDINASGPFIDNTGDMWVNVQDVRDVSVNFPWNSTAMGCLADSYYRYLYGAPPDQAYGLVKSVREELIQDGGLRQMLLHLGTSSAMRLRRPADVSARDTAVHYPVH